MNDAMRFHKSASQEQAPAPAVTTRVGGNRAPEPPQVIPKDVLEKLRSAVSIPPDQRPVRE